MRLGLILIVMSLGIQINAQTYIMPEETAEHEGTWIQWPHNHLYGPWYYDDVEPTFIAMTDALQEGENVHIIVYDSTELNNAQSSLTSAGVPFTNIDFYIFETDDVWVRDNGPMFVYSQTNELTILDWGFNGWGGDTPFSKCDVIPQSISTEVGTPLVDLNAMVLEGGAIEHDGEGTVMATRSSVTHTSRNPTLSETQIENYMTTYIGITNFIWLDGLYGSEITDMHIDGFVKFANDSTIVTMDSLDLIYWQLSSSDISTVYNASNTSGVEYNKVYLPLTQNDVITAYGNNLGYKGSYVNYYIGNDVVLVPTYNDPNDAVAINLIQNIYPGRTVVGVDVRNLYEYGGMIHCVTQQQPKDLNGVGINEGQSKRAQLKHYPNPVMEYAIIEFQLEGDSDVRIEIQNGLGQMVKVIRPEKGQNFVQIDVEDFESGIYYYSLYLNNEWIACNKMMISK